MKIYIILFRNWLKFFPYNFWNFQNLKMLQVGWFTRRIKILRQLKSKFDMLGIQKIKERYSFQEIRHPAACGKQLEKIWIFIKKVLWLIWSYAPKNVAKSGFLNPQTLEKCSIVTKSSIEELKSRRLSSAESLRENFEIQTLKSPYQTFGKNNPISFEIWLLSF